MDYMPAYNFKKEFAEDVASGIKCQTIRSSRKRPTIVGDTLYLYTGMRTKICRLLMTTECISISKIVIYPAAIILDGWFLSALERKNLAKADGFDSMNDFIKFFKPQSNRPFKGDLIKWN